MAFRIRHQSDEKGLLAVLPGASTRGSVSSSDIGKLAIASSNHAVLAAGTTADVLRAASILGIVAAVPTATTPGSTTPFYVYPLAAGVEVEADYSTDYEGSTGVSVIATSNIGKYLTWGNTTTIAAAAYIDPSLAGNAPGTTDCLFFKLTGFSTQNNTVTGVINSTHLAL